MAEDWGGEMKSGESELERGRCNGGPTSAFPNAQRLSQTGVIALTHAVKRTARLSCPAKLPGAVSTRADEIHRRTFPLGKPGPRFLGKRKADEVERNTIN